MPAPTGNITIALDDYRLFVHFAGGRVIQTIRAIEIKDRAGHESYLVLSLLLCSPSHPFPDPDRSIGAGPLRSRRDGSA